jgi:hypothetical protein
LIYGTISSPQHDASTRDMRIRIRRLEPVLAAFWMEVVSYRKI